MSEGFQPTILDEERKEPKPDVFTVRLNKEEREWLDESKKTININFDSTCIKILAKVGANVLHGTLGAKNLKYITSGRRLREVQE